MRIRHLSLPLAFLLSAGLVTVAGRDAPSGIRGTIHAAGLPTAFLEPTRPAPGSDLAWLDAEAERVLLAEIAEGQRQAAEQVRIETEAAAAVEAARVEAAEADRLARLARQATTTTVARRSTPTTVAASSAPRPTPSSGQASGSLPPKRVSDCESGGDPTAVNPNGHYGKWQFSQSTWESVGGTGRPDQASEAEQDKRASILWDNGNGSGHWSCY